MVCCISFGAINIKILIPLFGGLVNFTLKLLAGNSKIVDHPIMFSICSSLGMSLSFIPYFIMIKRIKTKKQRHLESLLSTQSKPVISKSLTIDYEYNDVYQEVTYDKFKYLILAAFIDFFQTLLTFFVYESINLNLWILEIILICSLSFYIFGIKLYKHQKLSLILIVILGLLLDLYINDFFRKGGVNFRSLVFLFIRIIGEVLFSFLMIVHKYLIEIKFSSPYEICFFVGIITLIFYSICIIISSFIYVNDENPPFTIRYDNGTKYYFDNFLIYISKVDIIEGSFFTIFMFIQFFFNLSVVLTIRYFSPTHILIILVIGKTEPFIQNIINKTNILDNTISLLILIVIFFVLLVFNEVIELNCFKLQKNTVKNIQKRAINESIQEMDNKSDDAFSSSVGSNTRSFDLGINDRELNENEEIEGKDLENLGPSSLVYGTSM